MRLLSTSLIMILCTIPIFAKGQYPEVQIMTWGYEMQWLQKKQTTQAQTKDWNLSPFLESSEVKKQRYLDRSSGLGFMAGVKGSNLSDSVRWDLDFHFNYKENTNSTDLLFGKNNYLMLGYQNLYFGVGRREFLYKETSFRSSFDGAEGLFFEMKPMKNCLIQVAVWDRYRGFPIKEKEMFRDLFREDKSEIKLNSHHRRHAFGFSYGEYYSLHFGTEFIELGTLGRHTKEIQKDVIDRGADGDHFLNFVLGTKLNFEFIEIHGNLLATKGTDRTLSKESTTKGSIPIRGEAIELGFVFLFSNWKIGTSSFLPDREERTTSNQIVRDGYIHTGTHIGSTYFFSQILFLFPSQSLQNDGLKKENSLYAGRSYAYFSESFLSVFFNDFELKLTGAYFLPYKSKGESDGKIQFKREFFESFFFAEVNLEIKLSVADGSELGLGVGQIYTNLSNSFEGNIGFFYGKVKF
ncbi:MAG: hypothetical protein MUF77_05550 [Leptospira sp.]|nr:hypothetical protein [Leptospira sp.]